MIELPRRSVTRFFIPLIDVMTLMFCIFLLLPVLPDAPGSAGEGSPDGGGTLPLRIRERQELADLRNKVRDLQAVGPEKERQELEQIRREKIEELQNRLLIRVLEIDADTGRLYYYSPERTEIASEADAHALIQRQKQEADGQELYYLILFPRAKSNYPLKGQIERYDQWFKGVAHRMENPRSGQ